MAPAAHYTCGGVLADLDGRTERARPLRRRRGRVHRRPRRRTGWPPTRSPRGWSRPAGARTLLAAELPAAGAPVDATGADRRDRPRRPGGGHRRDDPVRRGPARRRRAWRRAGRRAGRRPPARGRGRWTWRRWRRPRCTRSATLLGAAALARTESRGAHRRSDAPAHPPRVGGPARAPARRRRPAAHPHRARPACPPPALGRRHDAAQPRSPTPCTAAGLDPAEVERVVRRALDEDLAFGPDVTTDSTVAADAHGHRRRRPAVGRRARRGARRRGRLRPGRRAGGRRRPARRGRRGRRARAGRAHRHRPTRALLTAERTALNLVGHLSGVATLTRPLGGRRRRAPARRSATPARPRPGCARWRSTPSAAAAGSTTAWRSATRR